MTEPEEAKSQATDDQTESNSKCSLLLLALLVRLNEREVEVDEDGASCDKGYKQHKGEEHPLHQLRPGINIFHPQPWKETRDIQKQRQRQRQRNITMSQKNAKSALKVPVNSYTFVTE